MKFLSWVVIVVLMSCVVYYSYAVRRLHSSIDKYCEKYQLISEEVDVSCCGDVELSGAYLKINVVLEASDSPLQQLSEYAVKVEPIEVPVFIDDVDVWIENNKTIIFKYVDMLKSKEMRMSMSCLESNVEMPVGKVNLYMGRIIHYYALRNCFDQGLSFRLCKDMLYLSEVVAARSSEASGYALALAQFEKSYDVCLRCLYANTLINEELKEMMAVLLSIPNAKVIFKKTMESTFHGLVLNAKSIAGYGIGPIKTFCLSQSIDNADAGMSAILDANNIDYNSLAEMQRAIEADSHCRDVLGVPFLFIHSEAVQRFQGLQDDLRLRLALEIYEREHGEYPASLAQLAPQYLPELPVHPMGQGSYERVGDGYELVWRIE